MASAPRQDLATMEKPDVFHSFAATSFCGISCAQFWADFILWEALLNTHTQLRAIVELGTWQGGFSLYLAAQARGRGLEFRTYDATPPDRPIPGFVRLDIFAEAEQLGRWLKQAGPIALFCDNGNKPRELKTFPPYLAPGSIIVVHDWGTETLPADIPDTLIEIHGDYCDQLGSISRVFELA